MAIQELLMLSKDYYLDRAPKEIEQNRIYIIKGN